jgi:23S rRNA U2552 (ribose-2'-O)-methylase RlmE/FtsJ
MPVKFLEIGVDRGGSLQMWRNYFGPQAIIFGIDINPECQKYDGLAGNVRIGSQIDQSFLKKVIDEMGGVDVILDDGSHSMKHVPLTLSYLFPCLSDTGIYMIEDLHTAYWKRFDGGYYSRANFFNTLRELVDDMHHWYHKRKLKFPAIAGDCSAIHIHDSIVVLEKNKVFRPVHSDNG